MKKIFTFFVPLFFLFLSTSLSAQLNTGDIMFVGFVGDGSPGDINCGDGFSFAALADIPANTQIFFSEADYDGTSFAETEGDLSWSHTAIVPAGTVVQIVTNAQSMPCAPISASIGTAQFEMFNSMSTWAMATANEELYAYLGTLREPTVWLCGLFTDNSTGSNVPPAELSGFLLDFTNVDQDADMGIFTMGTNCPDQATCLANILNTDNWVLEDGSGSECCDMDGVDYPGDIPFNVGPCALPTVSSFDISSFTPTGLTLTATGALNDASEWAWYLNDCQSTAAQVDASNVFQLVDASSVNTVHLRGEGGCAGTSADCATFDLATAFTPTISLTNLCEDIVGGSYGGGLPVGGRYESNIITDNGDGLSFTIDPSSVGSGIYTITYTVGGKSVDGTIEIYALPDASFTYANSIFCVDDADPSPAITGVSGGFFTSSAELIIDATTGAIDVSMSTPGNYTVTYAVMDNCLGESTATVTISNVDDASFSYLATDYDTDGADPTPTITGLGGGTFSSMPAGLVIEGQTGLIDLSESAPNAYTVTYTTSGNCPNSSSFSLTVNEVVDPGPGNECTEANNIDNLFGGDIGVPQVSSSYDNTTYTSSGDPSTGLDCWDEMGTTNSIWYTFTGDGSTYRIRSIDCTNNNYNGDTQVAIYSGDCMNLTPVACNEDENSSDPNFYNIQVDIETEVGVNYWMLVDGHNGTVGEFCLEVNRTAPNAVTNILETAIQIYPNPTSGLIQFENIVADQVQLFDNLGHLILSQSDAIVNMDLTAVPAGFYFMKITAGKDVYSARIVKE